MATVIDELVTILGIDIKSGAMPTIQKFNSLVDGIAKTAAWASATLMTAASSIMYFTERSAQTSSEMHKFGQLTGMSTKTLQGWMFAAEQAGGDADALKNDLKGLTQSMSSPIPGEFNHALFMLGVSAHKAGGGLKTADEVLLNIADRFKGMSAQTQLQWASRIGLSEDTLLLLQMGREEIERLQKQAEDIPTIVGEEQLKNAREFVTQLSMLRRIMTYIGQEATSAAGPALKRIVQDFTAWLKLNKEFIQLKIKQLVDGIVLGFERFWDIMGRIKNSLVDVFPWLRKLFDGLTDVDVIAAVVTGSLAVLVGTLAVLALGWAKVAAAITIAAALFDDIITYIDGGSSAIGDLVDWVDELFTKFSSKFPGIAGLIRSINKEFKSLSETVANVLIKGLEIVGTVLGVIGKEIGRILGWITGIIDRELVLKGFGDMFTPDGQGGSLFNPSYKTNQTVPSHQPAANITINQNITGDNAVGVASESARKVDTTLQQLFPGGLSQVAN